MKNHLLICSLIAAPLTSALAVSTYTFSYPGPTYAVPDGNASGVFSSISVSGVEPVLLNVAVTLNLSGGYNGDLYAYLSHDGALVPLLNRIGVSGADPFGANGAGMNVSLSDSAGANIHAAGNGILSGTYRADGQNISPLSAPGSFNAAGGTITFNGVFGGMDPNGGWTLFVADVVAGGGASTLNNWELHITAVPEPAQLKLAAVLLFAGMILACRRAQRHSPTLQTQRTQVAIRAGRRADSVAAE